MLTEEELDKIMANCCRDQVDTEVRLWVRTLAGKLKLPPQAVVASLQRFVAPDMAWDTAATPARELRKVRIRDNS